MLTQALSSLLYSDWRQFGAIRVISPLKPESNPGPIDGLLTASLPLMAIVGILAGRSARYWIALGGISVGLLVMSQRNRSAHPMRERLIRLISIAAKAPH